MKVYIAWANVFIFSVQSFSFPKCIGIVCSKLYFNKSLYSMLLDIPCCLCIEQLPIACTFTRLKGWWDINCDLLCTTCKTLFKGLCHERCLSILKKKIDRSRPKKSAGEIFKNLKSSVFIFMGIYTAGYQHISDKMLIAYARNICTSISLEKVFYHH